MRFTTFSNNCSAQLSKLTKINEQVQAYPQEIEVTAPQVAKLNLFLKETKNTYSNFEKNLNKLLSSDGDAEAPSIFKENEKAILNFQNEIMELSVNIETHIAILLQSAVGHGNEALNVSTSSHTQPSANNLVRLPKLELKSFNGNTENWISYINLFDTTIHGNSSLSLVEKHQYLLSSLEGEALHLIKSLPISAGNYTVAYNALRERYHSTRRLISFHLNKIMDLPNISDKSVKGLRAFLNEFNENEQALHVLNYEVSDNNHLLSMLLLRKMDSNLCKQFESSRGNTSDFPTANEIIKFVKDICTHSEDAYLSHSQSTVGSYKAPSTNQAPPQFNRNSGKMGQRRPVALVSTPDDSKCFCCQDIHNVYSCPVFQEKSPQERYNIVRDLKRCSNCLGNHSIKFCKSKRTCKTCSRPHHSLLHFLKPVKSVTEDKQGSKDENRLGQNESSENSHPESNTSLVCKNDKFSHLNSTVLLATTLVKVKTISGNVHMFRGLLDSASQCSFLSERAAQLLNVVRTKSPLPIDGISGLSTKSKGLTNVSLETLSGKSVALNHPMIILEKITSPLPKAQVHPDVITYVKKYSLADPSFNVTGPIDILLGCELFANIFTGEMHSLGGNLPNVVGTVFGFTVMGKTPCLSDSQPSSFLTTLLSINDFDLHSSLQRFWQLEEPPAHTKLSDDETYCVNHFASTHSRDEDGRYVVRLPFKPNHSELGDSLNSAQLRMSSLEKKFSTQPQFQDKYIDFMKDYHTSGHMKKCDLDPPLQEPHFFLPHHGVIKETSSTTKLRVVFDASSRTSNNLSLNDILLPGPKLQTDVHEVLLNFRKYNVVFSCDIRQMYRQIKLHPSDQTFQLVLWRENQSEPLSVYKLTTVTYGINSSPFLAIKTLQQLATDEGDSFPAAKDILLHQTYMDDCVGGHDSEDEALELRNQLIQLMQKGGFELRKWVSNSPRLLEDIPTEHHEIPMFFHTSLQQAHFSILGLRWSASTDSFSYELNITRPTSPQLLTKRLVLSVIAQIFDPVGFLSPVTMKAKCFMQYLWTQKVNWDDPLTPQLAETWLSFVEELKCISNVFIPRSLGLVKGCSIQLHGFADASERGYASVVFLRTVTSDGQVIIRQLISKTRLAPLKSVSLPRLELCGAHLLAKIINACVNLFSTNHHVELIQNWCDSTIVLAWISTPPYKLKTFVSNRIAEIQELTPANSWRHVKGTDNPADCASRGLLPSLLQNHPLWWSGPQWLVDPPHQWPSDNIVALTEEDIPEVKFDPLIVLKSENENRPNDLLLKYSSWTKLLNVLTYVLRFVNGCRNRPISKNISSNRLTISELKLTENLVIKLVQKEVFSDDIERLQNQKPCSTRLQRISPFIDSNGIVRVGGRLKQSSLSYDSKHPVLIPKSHHIVNILIDYFHLKHLHAGPQLLQSLICQHYWILSARSVIRMRIFQCLKCFRCKPKNIPPLMGDLPSARVNCARPFETTGTDFCGPFTAKSHNLRSAKHFKIYICVFVCFVTKAVHLEPVTDLSTPSFIATLTRFVSRRGLPSKIYSDCGTNFIGADSFLKSLFKDVKNRNTILDFCNHNAIEFHFNPPAAPHQGGLWESVVKSFKYHFFRIINQEALTVEEYFTLTSKIEAILNSRPLTPLSSDPSDFTALTPGHFLIGTSLTSVPEPNFTELPTNHLRRWQRIQAYTQHIWQRWSQEYLNTLQQRNKWTLKKDNLKVGDLVLLQDLRTAPLCWPLGRIIEVSPGLDGVVRVVTVKTSTGTYKRPAVKVFPLPQPN